MNSNHLIFLSILFAVLMATVQSNDDSSKDSKSSGPLAFFQNLFSGIGGGSKKK
jgi:hypothetical protein